MTVRTGFYIFCSGFEIFIPRYGILIKFCIGIYDFQNWNLHLKIGISNFKNWRLQFWELEFIFLDIGIYNFEDSNPNFGNGNFKSSELELLIRRIGIYNFENCNSNFGN